MYDFQKKNSNRKEFYDAQNKTHREARVLRKQRLDGAFGDKELSDKNARELMYEGTSKAQK